MENENDNQKRQPASFRDQSGFLFWENGILYRQINKIFASNYDLLIKSGLYQELIKRNFLIPHTEAKISAPEAYKVIQPELLKFVSYPYEWCFSELKDAALLTLRIQKTAMNFGMSLRDASAYNIQFHNGKPVLIDTLSFEKYEDGRPWIAYRQFSQHFLAPLALMAHTDVRLNQLLRVYIDGIPLDLAHTLLPWRTRLMPSLAIHLHLHARAQKKYATKRINVSESGRRIDRTALLSLIDSLEDAVRGLDWKPMGTEWADYYDFTNYTDTAMEHKKELVAEALDETKPRTVWDLGANDGSFSLIASDKGFFTVSSDIDPAAVEKNYRAMKKRKEKNLLPLVIDLTNPTPALGWRNEERRSFFDRGPADMVFALALIHHLAISNNVPLESLAETFASLCRWLIIEFIPKEDSQVQKLLSSREDIFFKYNQNEFEKVFSKEFSIQKKALIKGSLRTFYLMKRK